MPRTGRSQPEQSAQDTGATREASPWHRRSERVSPDGGARRDIAYGDGAYDEIAYGTGPARTLRMGAEDERLVRVRLRNPDRTETLEGPLKVAEVLSRLGIHPDSVIVIRGDELLTREEVIAPGEELELRPVVSGG